MTYARFLRYASLAAMLITGAPQAWSQAATLRFVVPYPAGSPSDLLARVLAEQIVKVRGVRMVVENRPGAGGTIGTESVARAAPDGNTLLSVSPTFAIDPHLRKTGYDPLTSFEAICHLTNAPTIIAVAGDTPYRTLRDLLDAAREKPGVLTLAAVGPASSTHIAFTMLTQAAGVKMTFVPYPGPPPAINALLGGHVTSVFVPHAAAVGFLASGKLRALAVSSQTRIEVLPDVPTIAESGFPGYGMDTWFGVVAPAGTPKDTAARLAEWFASALQPAEVRAQLASLGLVPVGVCGGEFATMIRRKFEDYGRTMRDAKMVLE